ncbi:MAG: hypothetical protein KGJ80_16095 [Chloroflexota bacterium]|nr:hypothetical protein [Chloroflexota bacterium]
MSSLTDWAASVLETDEEILVPVKGLWNKYARRAPTTSLEEFSRALEQDARFEFIQGTDPTTGLDDWTEEEVANHVAEMEALGFFGGPRVKMKNREITHDHVAKMLKKHTDQMLSALWSAYDVRPEDLPEDAQKELLDLIAQAKELQLDVQEAIPVKEEDEDDSDRTDNTKRP